MADDSDGAARNEGQGGGTVSAGEGERREVRREGEAGPEPDADSPSLGERWDRATGVGFQHRKGRAADERRRDEGSDEEAPGGHTPLFE